MTLLSNIDIEKELVKGNLLIFPFKKDNLKGASYNLTASHLAWKIPDKEGEPYVSIYDGFNTVIIPGKSSVLIVTNETIWVSEEIAGTYHSKVRMVSKGTGHIGTTLDPGYMGVSVITIHNHTEKDIHIVPGETTFASIMFQFVRTKSAPEQHDNRPGRPDVLNQVGRLTEKENEWLNERFRNYKESLQSKLRQDSQDFRDILEIYKNKNNRFNFLFSYLIYLVFIIASSSLAGYLNKNQSSLKQANWYSAAIFFADKATVGFTGALIVQLVSDIQRKK